MWGAFSPSEEQHEGEAVVSEGPQAGEMKTAVCMELKEGAPTTASEVAEQEAGGAPIGIIAGGGAGVVVLVIVIVLTIKCSKSKPASPGKNDVEKPKEEEVWA